MFHVEIQARLANGAVMNVSATSEDRRTAIRRALDSMPLGSVAVSTVVTSSSEQSRLFAPLS
ncbi:MULTISPECIES: HPF/RaiA family ribosome-associated protein [unclassified Frondihabitans]|uniref:HPF/RaiA family ribosome-associated protein n=1 Tax=unclassified Frondihabitans TaxID=2626248 RepID=UPI0007011200|nr:MULTISPECIES: HPF/RaiA family ribosome-associated protein [unclassified Frondihabitans]KQQ26670.1 hypothetical protein ASF54_11895 [Frondihabitans sp. Leaf304]RPE76298.1 hypothetical protein EDF37_2119 [Frondihabitans sp. PhB153]RPF05426.1 hypothetical protein EDF39_2129 [Frondihabitans sp. PhB161]